MTRLPSSRPYRMPMSSLAAQLETQSRRVRGLPSIRRRTSGRRGESLYDQEERLKLEMQMRLREQRFALPGQAEQARMEEKIANEGWERRYTAKQRMDMAQLESALEQLEGNPNFSEEEKIIAGRSLRLGILGIKPTAVPPDPNKLKFEPGREPGKTWEDSETGARMTTIIGSSGSPEAKLVVRPDQTMQYMQSKFKATQLSDWETERRKKEMEWGTELLPARISTDGDEQEPARYRENWEVQELLQRYFPAAPGSFEQMAGQEQLQPPQVPPAPTRPPIPQLPRAQPPKEMFSLGQEESFLRSMEGKYKGDIENIPDNVLREMKRAYNISDRRRKEKRGSLERFKDWAESKRPRR